MSKVKNQNVAPAKAIPLSKYCNGPQPAPREDFRQALDATIRNYPLGKQASWGLPFTLTTGTGNRVILLDKNTPAVSVRLDAPATFVCLLHTWIQRPQEAGVAYPSEGQPVGEYTFVYADGTRYTHPIRAQFEVPLKASSCAFLYPCLALEAKLPGATGAAAPVIFLYAMPNPHPEKTIHSLHMAGLHASPLVVAGMTLYNGPNSPVQYLPRRLYRVKVNGIARKVESAAVDLGAPVRVESVGGRRGKEWLHSPYAGLRTEEPRRSGEDLLEVIGAPDARVSVKLKDKGKTLNYTFSLGEAFSKGKSRMAKGMLEAVEEGRQWVAVRIIDESTGKPTPVRIQFSGANGEYLPLHGHGYEINTKVFENFYVGDIVVGGRNYSYVQGEFTTELPVGEVYVEICKGFEYEVIRRKVIISPNQKTLELKVKRWIDLSTKGWITGDTHVHLKSPQRCWLEGQAEGLNIIHLMAFQMKETPAYQIEEIVEGDAVNKEGTLVQVGTENLSDVFGHFHFIGMKGVPHIVPLNTFLQTAGGAAVTRTFTECAREVKRRGGLVIRAHFPYCGKAEDPLLIMNGLMDALEINTAWDDGYSMKEWYRYLNCGYRVAVAGGTDIYQATRAIGDHRTYAKLVPGQAVTFKNWAAAVRAGRTYTTTGPLLEFTVNGNEMGSTVNFPAAGGTVNVEAMSTSYWPLGRLELVCNGRVVALVEARHTEKKLRLQARIPVSASGWLAVRCYCRKGHPAQYMSAHSSPVYLKCGKTRAFDTDAARHVLALINGGMDYLATLATPFDALAQQRMLGEFNDVKTELENRLAAHCADTGGGDLAT